MLAGKNGLTISRRFTAVGVPVSKQIQFERRDVVIRGPDGKTIFSMDGVEVPVFWSRLATDILAQKYFRKSGLPDSFGLGAGETSILQVTHRMADCWMQWGKRYGYFKTVADAEAFYDEVSFMLLDQRMAPNSPQWFNTGLFTAYGIKGPPQGHYFIDPGTGQSCLSSSAYERPQPHACFILSVKDDLVNPGGIMDLWMREARIFKYGSGTGTNFSSIRAAGEPLSGGGTSSGLMSFLRIGDAAAGAIRSGGTTRRAAKMVCLDADHPEILSFIRWKADEERKAKVLLKSGESGTSAYSTVSGQHSNNSVRLSDAFMHALDEGLTWDLIARTDSRVLDRLPAAVLWRELCTAAWYCADPGVQFDTTINQWHTCPAGGKIRSSNPCSEYMFLDDTSCNLASVNLLKFIDPVTGKLQIGDFVHACRITTIMLELSVLMAQYPSEEVARNSFDYRTVGLGYANLANVFMVNGWAYDSPQARAMAGAVTALMTGIAYKTSAELATVVGPFPKFSENRTSMLNVVSNHLAAIDAQHESTLGFSRVHEGVDASYCDSELLAAARCSLKEALREGEQAGFRNAQVTAIAPTGTISLIMDCDTTGIEPEYALVRLKRMLDGSEALMVNGAVERALIRLGYDLEERKQLSDTLKRTGVIIGHDLLKSEHESVFHCATSATLDESQTISVDGHLSMMAAVQPFLSGGISKTVNLPASCSVDDVSSCFLKAWKYGLKSVAVYRQGCKSFQPLEAIAGHMTFDRTPICSDCGFHTIREGACFKCPNCGSTVGCS